jgi:hypothetical protein
MLAEILQAAHRLQYGETLHLRPLLCQLHDGFLEHIERVDKEYGPWLRERGIFFTWLSFVDFMPITFALALAGSSIPMH